jgi:hypothetical protein
MTDIGLRKVVPGANDNGTSVVTLLALARRFAAEPPEGTKVILLSTGSEESFSEGMKAFGERHFAALPRESTFFLCLESIGSPHLLVLRGEGFLKMNEYPPRSLAFMDELAEDLALPQPASAQRHRRAGVGRSGLRDGGARRLHRPQAAGQLPLVARPRRERRLRDRGRRNPAQRGGDQAPRQVLVVGPD